MRASDELSIVSRKAGQDLLPKQHRIQVTLKRKPPCKQPKGQDCERPLIGTGIDIGALASPRLWRKILWRTNQESIRAPSVRRRKQVLGQSKVDDLDLKSRRWTVSLNQKDIARLDVTMNSTPVENRSVSVP